MTSTSTVAAVRVDTISVFQSTSTLAVLAGGHGVAIANAGHKTTCNNERATMARSETKQTATVLGIRLSLEPKWLRIVVVVVVVWLVSSATTPAKGTKFASWAFRSIQVGRWRVSHPSTTDKKNVPTLSSFLNTLLASIHRMFSEAG